MANMMCFAERMVVLILCLCALLCAGQACNCPQGYLCCNDTAQGSCYYPTQYSCIDNKLCPASFLACGIACYDPEIFGCNNGALQLLGSQSAPTASVAANRALGSMLKSASSTLARQSLLQPAEYLFNFQNATLGVSKGTGGTTVAANADTFPALIGNGIAMTVGYIGPCSINLPHTHPRATEINFIVEGEFEAGFFQENMARFIGNTIQKGMATVFPQGSIHFEQNLNCEPAMFVAAFNSEDPGVLTVAEGYFGLPAEIAAAGLNISVTTVEQLAQFLPANPALGLLECRQRCGLSTEINEL